ncbi:hypothetical protein PSACC_03182 [Paramicrosporidium saccamoebae]|uniref:Uncharacterized protein n=1 Tax=Paramicrosporidium saccamoebae TaxID=1246581 RepID=A0A2H9TH04_9FUNG|nr:hypothetical protein PSACC_03182 [Paramicrosporidium saccamoebae]
MHPQDIPANSDKVAEVISTAKELGKSDQNAANASSITMSLNEFLKAARAQSINVEAEFQRKLQRLQLLQAKSHSIENITTSPNGLSKAQSTGAGTEFQTNLQKVQSPQVKGCARGEETRLYNIENAEILAAERAVADDTDDNTVIAARFPCIPLGNYDADQVNSNHNSHTLPTECLPDMIATDNAGTKGDIIGVDPKCIPCVSVVECEINVEDLRPESQPCALAATVDSKNAREDSETPFFTPAVECKVADAVQDAKVESEYQSRPPVKPLGSLVKPPNPPMRPLRYPVMPPYYPMVLPCYPMVLPCYPVIVPCYPVRPLPPPVRPSPPPVRLIVPPEESSPTIETTVTTTRAGAGAEAGAELTTSSDTEKSPRLGARVRFTLPPVTTLDSLIDEWPNFRRVGEQFLEGQNPLKDLNYDERVSRSRYLLLKPLGLWLEHTGKENLQRLAGGWDLQTCLDWAVLAGAPPPR